MVLICLQNPSLVTLSEETLNTIFGAFVIKTTKQTTREMVPNSPYDMSALQPPFFLSLYRAIGMYGTVQRVQHRTVSCSKELTIWQMTRGSSRGRGVGNLARVQGVNMQSQPRSVVRRTKCTLSLPPPSLFSYLFIFSKLPEPSPQHQPKPTPQQLTPFCSNRFLYSNQLHSTPL